jgi:hypothetical protein
MQGKALGDSLGLFDDAGSCSRTEIRFGSGDWGEESGE